MGRPSGGYKLADGTKVPSVTTIIGRFKECGGLIHWAWRLGMDGMDYREERDSAANAGTLAHGMVEAWIRGEKFDVGEFDVTPDEIRKAKQAFESFLEWADQSNLEIIESEVPLVSEKHKFGGTFDAILVKGKRSMGDWKTSNNVYAEYMIQLAAYAKLWEEHHPDQPIDGGHHLIRFDKEHADFHHHFWRDLDEAWDAFLHMRSLYETMKSLKKRAS